MAEPLRILITNDDGIDAPGLKIMQQIAAELTDDWWVLAPKKNQSGAGHRFSLSQELKLQKRASNIYFMDGTPADCTVIGCTYLLSDRKPDIVLSGVNHGQNLGDMIHCSGTMAGAREGVLQGALGIAMSQAVDMHFKRANEIEWSTSANYGAEIVRGLLAENVGTDTVYNVNFPMAEEGKTPTLRVVPHQRYSTSPFHYYPSRRNGKFFVAIPETPQPLHPDHDFHVLHHEHAITITPITLKQTDDAVAKRLGERLSLTPRAAQ